MVLLKLRLGHQSCCNKPFLQTQSHTPTATQHCLSSHKNSITYFSCFYHCKYCIVLWPSGNKFKLALFYVFYLASPKSATLTTVFFPTRQLRAARSRWMKPFASRYSIAEHTCHHTIHYLFHSSLFQCKLLNRSKTCFNNLRKKVPYQHHVSEKSSGL